MKFLFSYLVILCLFAGLYAEAHQIVSDNGVTVLLHVDPSDEPYSGTTTRMYLVFMGDTAIDPGECDCVAYIAPYSKLAAIKEEGVAYDFRHQSERILGSYSIEHVFPRHDVYAVVLEGSPAEGADFEPFRIVYALRVARGEEISLAPPEAQPALPFLHPYMLIGAGIGVIALGFLGWRGIAPIRRRV